MIKSWALTLAIAAVIVAVVEGLAPKGKLEKGIKIVSGIFLALVMVSPLTMLLGADWNGGSGAPSSSFDADQSVQLEVRESVLSMTRDNLRVWLESALLKKTGHAAQVSLVSLVEQDGILAVERVELVLPEGASHDAATDAIRADLGLDVEVVIKEETGE